MMIRKSSERIKDIFLEKVLIKTIINRCVKLAGTGFLIHSIVKERI